MNLAKFFSTETLLTALLGKGGLEGLLPLLLARFQLADVLGLVILNLQVQYSTQGRDYVLRAATIPEATLIKLAKKFGVDSGSVILAGRVVTTSVANLVETLVPRPA